MPDSDLITPKAAANLLGKSRKTVYRWFDKGWLAGRRYPSGSILISRESVEELIANCTLQACPPENLPL